MKYEKELEADFYISLSGDHSPNFNEWIEAGGQSYKNS